MHGLSDEDRSFYERRLAQERQGMENSGSPVVRRAHAHLATIYELRLGYLDVVPTGYQGSSEMQRRARILGTSGVTIRRQRASQSR